MAAVRNCGVQAELTASTLAELQMIMSRPASCAAGASSCELLVTCVHFRLPYCACMSAMATVLSAGHADQV